MVLQIDEAAAAAALLVAWASAPGRERDAAAGLLQLAGPPATPDDAAPTPPIWERLEALPDPVGGALPMATSTPKKVHHRGSPVAVSDGGSERRWSACLMQQFST